MSVPRVAGRWFRLNLWLHRWSSLVATPFFLILCITGVVLTFHEEIDGALGYVPPVRAAPSGQSRPAADSARVVQAAHRDSRIAVVSRDPAERPGQLYFYVIPKSDIGFDHGKPVYVETATARILPASDPAKTPTGFLLELHANWFLGPAGELVGAFIALLVLISILSGLVVYAPYVKRIAFGVLRRGRGARLLQLDLHNFIGAVVLGWLLVVTVTGICLGLGTVALGMWQNTELQSLATRLDTGVKVDRENPPITFDRAMESASRIAPGWQANTVFFPGTELSTPQHYTVLLYGPKGLQEKLYRIALVEASTGRVADVREFPAYLKAIQLSQPLHFGDYGGLPLKILWVICALLTLFITGNGAWLWWYRRRPGKVLAVLEDRLA